jgi:UDP-N-acetyl-D-glucosamine dehydrogenase
MSQSVFVMPETELMSGGDAEAGDFARSLHVAEERASPAAGAAQRYVEPASVAIVGLGYVGLPTALGLHDSSLTVHGVDVSAARVAAVRSGAVDLTQADRERLTRALAGEHFHTGTDDAAVGSADVVVICVPTGLDRHLSPDLGPIRSACHNVVERARAGQTIILTSTSYAGTTRDLLTEPLRRRGFTIGQDVFVAFSPERIDPGVAHHTQSTTPRVVGGETPQCTARASAVLRRLTNQVHPVSTPATAEMTKLYENTFRAVTLALANEFAEICGTLSLDPIEVTTAAATKPYGFLAVDPGPGVGGHCIPCDPHYLLWQLRKVRGRAPLTEQAMASIAGRPRQVVNRAVELLSDSGTGLRGARVIVVGVTYKPGVQDLRESTALEILLELRRRGADVAFHDPLISRVTLADGTRLDGRAAPDGADYDLAVVHTVHPAFDYPWVTSVSRVLDATYRFDPAGRHPVV